MALLEGETIGEFAINLLLANMLIFSILVTFFVTIGLAMWILHKLKWM